MRAMTDYRRTPLKEGDTVAIYWGYNDLKTGTVVKIQGARAKVEVDGTVSKWKSGCCMVKLED
jgi:hypothetical protein